MKRLLQTTIPRAKFTDCPFCFGQFALLRVDEDKRAVVHTDPMCPKFEAEDPLVFLRNARVALPDDDEWPLPVRDGGTN